MNSRSTGAALDNLKSADAQQTLQINAIRNRAADAAPLALPLSAGLGGALGALTNPPGSKRTGALYGAGLSAGATGGFLAGQHLGAGLSPDNVNPQVAGLVGGGAGALVGGVTINELLNYLTGRNKKQAADALPAPAKPAQFSFGKTEPKLLNPHRLGDFAGTAKPATKSQAFMAGTSRLPDMIEGGFVPGQMSRNDVSGGPLFPLVSNSDTHDGSANQVFFGNKLMNRGTSFMVDDWNGQNLVTTHPSRPVQRFVTDDLERTVTPTVEEYFPRANTLEIVRSKSLGHPADPPRVHQNAGPYPPATSKPVLAPAVAPGTAKESSAIQTFRNLAVIKLADAPTILGSETLGGWGEGLKNFGKTNIVDPVNDNVVKPLGNQFGQSARDGAGFGDVSSFLDKNRWANWAAYGLPIGAGLGLLNAATRKKKKGLLGDVLTGGVLGAGAGALAGLATDTIAPKTPPVGGGQIRPDAMSNGGIQRSPADTGLYEKPRSGLDKVMDASRSDVNSSTGNRAVDHVLDRAAQTGPQVAGAHTFDKNLSRLHNLTRYMGPDQQQQTREALGDYNAALDADRTKYGPDRLLGDVPLLGGRETAARNAGLSDAHSMLRQRLVDTLVQTDPRAVPVPPDAAWMRRLATNAASGVADQDRLALINDLRGQQGNPDTVTGLGPLRGGFGQQTLLNSGLIGAGRALADRATSGLPALAPGRGALETDPQSLARRFNSTIGGTARVPLTGTPGSGLVGRTLGVVPRLPGYLLKDAPIGTKDVTPELVGRLSAAVNAGGASKALTPDDVARALQGRLTDPAAAVDPRLLGAVNDLARGKLPTAYPVADLLKNPDARARLLAQIGDKAITPEVLDGYLKNPSGYSPGLGRADFEKKLLDARGGLMAGPEVQKMLLAHPEVKALGLAPTDVLAYSKDPTFRPAARMSPPYAPDPKKFQTALETAVNDLRNNPAFAKAHAAAAGVPLDVLTEYNRTGSYAPGLTREALADKVNKGLVATMGGGTVSDGTFHVPGSGPKPSLARRVGGAALSVPKVVVDPRQKASPVNPKNLLAGAAVSGLNRAGVGARTEAAQTRSIVERILGGNLQTDVPNAPLHPYVEPPKTPAEEAFYNRYVTDRLAGTAGDPAKLRALVYEAQKELHKLRNPVDKPAPTKERAPKGADRK